MKRPTRAVVDLDAIAENFRALEVRAGGPGRVFPVVKADAYGHGALPVAGRLAREGAVRFAVALAEEGLALREGGIEGEILLLSSGDPSDAAELARHRLTPSLYDPGQARAMSESARALPAPLPVHVKLDTGMGRLGFRPEQMSELVALLRASPALKVTGIFTQFARADEPESEATRGQLAAFRLGVAAFRNAGIDPGLVHAANSAGALWLSSARFDAVRPGLALYGISPADRTGATPLRPALSLETRVLSIKTLPAGSPVGYGGTFVTARKTDVAALPIGYHDGLRRSLSGGSHVLMQGGNAPIIGAVSMDLTLVDVTDCGARPGDRAVVLGRVGAAEVTAWDLARAAGTVPWEILCGIGARVPRVYVP